MDASGAPKSKATVFASLPRYVATVRVSKHAPGHNVGLLWLGVGIVSWSLEPYPVQKDGLAVAAHL
jgi:hypothetical protein